MSDRFARRYLAAVAGASILAVMLVPYSRWSDLAIFTAAGLASYGPLIYWDLRGRMDWRPWMATTTLAILFGSEGLIKWRHYEHSRYHDLPRTLYGVSAIVLFSLLFLVVFGPGRLRLPPKPKPSFSLLGRSDGSPSSDQGNAS